MIDDRGLSRSWLVQERLPNAKESTGLSLQKCPKCGRKTKASTSICSGCDFVFGDEVDVGGSTKKVASAARPGDRPVEISFGEDDVILGDAASAEFQQFRTADVGIGHREVTNARIYIGVATQMMLRADAILQRVDAEISLVELNPIEEHVLAFVNGRRPLGRVRRKTGLSMDELRTSVATLADKGALKLRGYLSEERKRAARKKRERRRSNKGAEKKPRDRGGEDFVERTPALNIAAHQAESIRRYPKGTRPAPKTDDVDPDFGAEVTGRTPPRPRSVLLENEFDSVEAPRLEDDFDEIDASPQVVAEDAEPNIFDEATGKLLAADSEMATGESEIISLSASEIDIVEEGYDPYEYPPVEPPEPPEAPEVEPEPAGSQGETLTPGIYMSGDESYSDYTVAGELGYEDDPDEAGVLSAPSDGDGEPEVSFDHRRKGEKIFEQATEDAAAGKVGSAVMNVKLALIYDPKNAEYLAKLEAWGTAAQQQKQSKSPEMKLYEQSRSLEAEGKYRDAVRCLEKAIDLAPRAAPLRNRIGVLLATRLQQYDPAVEYIMQACDLAPSNLSFKNNLGKVLGMAESARTAGKKPKSFFEKRKSDKGKKIQVKKL